MKGELHESVVTIHDKPQIDRLSQRGFGTIKEDSLNLTLMESLFLLERGTLEIYSKKKRAGKDTLLKRVVDEADFSRRYVVYKDLRERGFVIKTGFKFGAHFRVYEKGEYSNNGHSTMLVHVVTEDEVMSFPEVSRSVRLTQSVKKKMIFAVVDDEEDITYYLIDRIVF